MYVSKLTVLEAASSIILTKRHRKDGTDSYGDAKWYSFQEMEVGSIAELAQVIDSIADSPSKAIILDQFVGAATASKVQHNEQPVFNKTTGRVRRVIEAFDSAPSNILCFDIDGWEGGSADPLSWVDDPESAICEWVAEYLPAAFQNVDFYWQVSSSAGLKRGVRAHVWFWLSEQVTKAQLGAWVVANVKPESTVDKSLYSRVRIHYTATPIFEGIEDPVAVRSGIYDSMMGDTVEVSIQDFVEVGDHVEFTGDDDDDGFLEAMAAQPPLGLTKSEAADIIAALDAEWVEDRAKWLEIGMALHHEFGGSVVGFELWCEWSKQSEKYDLKDQKTVWKSFRQTRRTLVKTMASVKKIVKASGVGFEQLLQKLESVTNYRQALEIISKYDLDDMEIDSVATTLSGICKRGGMSATVAVCKKAIKKARSEHLAKNESHKVYILEDWLAGETIRQAFGSEKRLMHFGKMYWGFNNGHWHKIDEGGIENRVYQLVKSVSNSLDLEALHERLTESGRTEALNALCGSVAGIVKKRCSSNIDRDPMGLSEFPRESIMNCMNGELVFNKDGATSYRDHNPDNKLTAVLATEYDPDAECPEWDKALERIFQGYPDRDDMIRHLHEVMGYICQTKRNLAAWVMFYGKGSNGKSFIGGVLQALIGPTGSINVSLGSFSEHKKNDHVEAQIVGKMLMIDDDFAKGSPLPDGTLKKLSESKNLTANPKFADSFNFVSRVTPVLLTNHWPRTSDNSYGLTRRAIVFNFKNTLSEEEKDIDLLDRISANELPGVLNRLIAGWERLQKRGRFQHPKSCQDAKNEWLGNRNVVAVYMAEKMIVTSNPTDTVIGSEVWRDFKEWGVEENAGGKWGRNSFYSELGATPGVVKYTNGDQVTMFRGVKMRTPSDPMDDDDDDDMI